MDIQNGDATARMQTDLRREKAKRFVRALWKGRQKEEAVKKRGNISANVRKKGAEEGIMKKIRGGGRGGSSHSFGL
jgi:hypothetical protein